MGLRVCRYKNRKDDIECGGQMFLETYGEACKECAKSGATVCGDCKIHFEWACLQGGHRLYMKPIKRKELYAKQTT